MLLPQHRLELNKTVIFAVELSGDCLHTAATSFGEDTKIVTSRIGISGMAELSLTMPYPIPLVPPVTTAI
jgi:hypothetical protein